VDLKVKRSRTKKILIFSALTLAIVGFVLYRLADRYLIEHVEAVVVTSPVKQDITAVSGDAASTSGTAQTAEASGGTAETTAAAASEVVASDDWNYKTSDTSISVRKVQTGTGSDRVTYFVADVQVKDASSLLSAFAKNEFGRNITENTSTIASRNNAVFAINGDYYGFRSDGVIIRNGVLYRNEPARIGLALFTDGTIKSYDETQQSASSLLASGVLNTLSFGPALLQNGQITGSFDSVAIDKNFGNRSIQDLNPRTGIGMIAPNHYVFVVVDGRKENYSKGSWGLRRLTISTAADRLRCIFKARS
jgi:exopolysaccharide biosynthesis protein